MVTRFTKEAYFVAAVFHEGGEFVHAHFAGDANFKRVASLYGLSFVGVEVIGHANFSEANIRLVEPGNLDYYFKRTRFTGRVTPNEQGIPPGQPATPPSE